VAMILPDTEGEHTALVNNAPQKHSKGRRNTPKDESAQMWHLRTGHLGKKALEKMVETTRGVRIEGVKRIDCEVCSLTHAENVVSRKTSERMAARPFWRVHWDLQDYPESYNGMNWLIVFKDEYSRWIWCKPLPNKSHTTVFNAILHFERWVKRQFGVMICVFRHDNERAVIAVQGNTGYQNWTMDEGIGIEASPPYTKEPNGGSERANKTITTKSIAMLSGAQLPGNLWSESTEAATYLYNMSPSETLGWKSPNEVLHQWMKNHAHIPTITYSDDLRPDWSHIVTYGCRAYVLQREREAGINNRGYKV